VWIAAVRSAKYYYCWKVLTVVRTRIEGKGGLSIGTVLGGGAGTLIYVNPTIAFYGNFGRRKVTWSTNLGVGFGLIGGTKALTLRGAYEIFLGSTGIFGVDGLYTIPETTTTGNLTGYFGVHLGVAFGR
jgi:hypothetical protein